MQTFGYPPIYLSAMIRGMHFPEYGSQYDFPGFEASVLKYWKDQRIFERLLSTKVKRKEFGFYDGPPFATGLPHYGHLLAGTIKDIVPRYWTMRGYHCERRFGWDTHGLPVEYEIEKKLKLKGSPEILEYGVDKFNEACREVVLRYTSEWREVVERMGRWVDLDNDYKTMDPEFMESIWWVFKELWDKKLIYQGKKVVPYSWRITSPLSNFEAGLNYKSVQDPAITVLFADRTKKGEAFLAWTTTPWTLPGNLALCAHPKLTYVRVALKDQTKFQSAWIVQDRLADYENELEQDPLETSTGSDLVGREYEPLFDFFADERNNGAFKVIEADFVTATDGTGFVHTAPAFGENDFYAGKKAGLGLVDPTNDSAEFTHVAGPYQGKFVKDADKDIIKDLKTAGNLLVQKTIQHNYPFCYRSDTPLVYKAINSWFVNVESFRDRMVEHNKGVRWVPGHLRDGRFGKWLENARDWCISRNRFWGTPIPVWICTECDHKIVMGSREELAKLAGRPIDDLHSHKIDDIEFGCPSCVSNKTMIRTPEVLDCWFESGSMPYAQLHYPFENKQAFEAGFPADFIAEGLDQTRGWFYTLTVLSAALFDKPAFRNCVVNGMILAEDGKKMSKSLQNYPDPTKIIDKYGADSIRLYFMQSPAVHGEELRFSEKQLVEHMRAVMIPLWNAYGFFASYANIDGFQREDLKDVPALEDRPKIDRWILALLRKTEVEVHDTMERYELAPVAGHITAFVDNLTNWYIRLNRQRFWSAKGTKFSADKLSAYGTMWEIFDDLSRLIGPFLPFFSECLYTSIHSCIHPNDLPKFDGKSVHEAMFKLHRNLSDTKENYLKGYIGSEELKKPLDADQGQLLIDEMEISQTVILLGRSLRSDARIGLRQPLPKVTIAGLSSTQEHNLSEMKTLVLSELNVKNLEICQNKTELVEESVKPNLPRIGPRAGKNMKAIMAELKTWGTKEIASFEKKGTLTIADVELTAEDILIVRKAKSGKCAGALRGIVAELDTQLTKELLREGLEREIINRIQQRRKGMEFNLADRIQVAWAGEGACSELLDEETKKEATISQETLAVKWQPVPLEKLTNQEKFTIEQDGNQSWFALDLTVTKA